MNVNCTVQKNTNWKVVLKFRSMYMYMYMYSGDLDVFGKSVHKDCFKKCIHIFEIHKWISVSRDVHS